MDKIITSPIWRPESLNEALNQYRKIVDIPENAMLTKEQEKQAEDLFDFYITAMDQHKFKLQLKLDNQIDKIVSNVRSSFCQNLN